MIAACVTQSCLSDIAQAGEDLEEEEEEGEETDALPSVVDHVGFAGPSGTCEVFTFLEAFLTRKQAP